jgi:hypothetical protein
MTSVPTAAEYRDELRRLLDRGRDTLTTEEQHTLRNVVRAHRNRRRGHDTIQTSSPIHAHAAMIVNVLENAARVLRPQETQDLDDLVAGIERLAPEPGDRYAPVRLRRRNSP